MLKLVTGMSKLFATLFTLLERPTLFWWIHKIIFRSVSSYIFRYCNRSRKE